MRGDVFEDMEAGAEAQIMQAAMRWSEASARGDCDWDALAAWLEADPAHQRAFADVALLEDQIARHRSQLAVTDVAVQPRSMRRWWPAGVAAAVLFAATLMWQLQPLARWRAQDYIAAQTARSISLADGSRVLLAPGSRMQVSGWSHDRIALTGVAYFDVHHDPARSLAVTVGDYLIHDIGTRFEVVGGAHELKVAVAEGSVAVTQPGGAVLAVTAGNRLLVSGRSPVAEYASIAGEDVAGWRDGRLVFHNEPLSVVVRQLSPHAGVVVTVDAAIAARRFSGVLAIGDGAGLVSQLEEIMDLVEQRDAAGVHLAAAAGR